MGKKVEKTENGQRNAHVRFVCPLRQFSDDFEGRFRIVYTALSFHVMIFCHPSSALKDTLTKGHTEQKTFKFVSFWQDLLMNTLD